MTFQIPTTLIYGQKYQILNGHNGFGAGYLAVGHDGAMANKIAMGDSLNCVVTINYNEQWDGNKHGDGSVWTIMSATGKAIGTPVMYHDSIFLRAGFARDQKKVYSDAAGGYLDTRGYGCQDNHLCVSASGQSNRDSGSGTWSIVTHDPDGGVDSAGEVHRGDEIHLRNGWDKWQGGFLETRGYVYNGNTSLLSVSTRKEWNGGDALSQTWKFVNVGQMT